MAPENETGDRSASGDRSVCSDNSTSAPCSKWDELRWPGLWAPLVAVVAYLVSAVFYSAVGLALVRARAGPVAGLPSADILAWANLAAIATMGGLSLLFVAQSNRREDAGKVLRLAARVERRDFAPVLVLFLISVPASVGIALLLTVKFGLSVDPQVTDILMTPVSMVAAVVVAPVGEELWARGLVYGALRRWGPWVAVIGATAVSAGLHYEPVRVVGVLPIMLALSWLRNHTGSLAPCVLLHASYNLFLVGIASLVRTVTG